MPTPEGRILHKTGFIMKAEQIVDIRDNIVKDTLVADALEPFPGYHGKNLPERQVPYYVFLFLKEDYPQEVILRAAQRIKKYTDMPFEAHYGQLTVYNNEAYPVVRLRHMEDYEHVKPIQECFLDEGVVFHKHVQMQTKGLLKVYKCFEMEREKEGIYKDLHEECMHYLEMPREMNWRLFAEVTRQVKNNVERSNFDAAMATMYCYKGLKDYVRVYCQKDYPLALEEVREKYIEFMQRMTAEGGAGVFLRLLCPFFCTFACKRNFLLCTLPR